MAVFGEGAGNMEPLPPGVSPVLMPDSFGVKPVRGRWLGSNALVDGPWSIAGDKGPDRSDSRPHPKADEPPPLWSREGDSRAATLGRMAFGVARGSEPPLDEPTRKETSNGLGSRSNFVRELMPK